MMQTESIRCSGFKSSKTPSRNFTSGRLTICKSGSNPNLIQPTFERKLKIGLKGFPRLEMPSLRPDAMGLMETRGWLDARCGLRTIRAPNIGNQGHCRTQFAGC